LDEYVNSEELGVTNKISDAPINELNNFLQTDKAKNFYRKWLALYGDDSIAELAGIHLGIENISMIAAKFIEDRRVGISPLEKSTRYVRFDDKTNEGYKYYRIEK
jgi:thymidylate synthase ThyX